MLSELLENPKAIAQIVIAVFSVIALFWRTSKLKKAHEVARIDNDENE